MKPLRYWRRWITVVVTLVAVLLLSSGEAYLPQDMETRLDILTSRWQFNFFSWETRALARKGLYKLLAPQRFMSDSEQARFVLDYLDDVRHAQDLAYDIDQIYIDPEIADPEAASRAEQAELAELRGRISRSSPVAEAILEEQVSAVLAEGGFGTLATVLPPVSGSFTPLPHILIISPRDRIASLYQQQLIAGLTAADQEALEVQVMAEFANRSAYVTSIGGLAAYPAMLLETSSIDWVLDVFAHEWVHHYLSFFPLGWSYIKSGEARTINETTASLVGDWAGYEIFLHYYAPLLERDKHLPDPLEVERGPDAPPPEFDFRAEMHHTRVVVDRLLEEGRIKEAEWYMEAQRRYFVAQGYRLRRLNQAYFAFHGAYADAPGAAGENPIGPAVRTLWALSATPQAFTRRIAVATTLTEVQALLN